MHKQIPAHSVPRRSAYSRSLASIRGFNLPSLPVPRSAFRISPAPLNPLPSITYQNPPRKTAVIFGPETVKNGHEIAKNRPKNVKKAPQLVTGSA